MEPTLAQPEAIMGLQFGGVLERLRAGSKVARASWPEGRYLVAIHARGKKTSRYVVVKTSSGPLAHWVPAPSDLMASDWYEREDVKTDAPRCSLRSEKQSI